MRIHLAEIFVNDQEQAARFYVDVLGFVVHTDTPYGDGRWLTVVSPQEPDGPQLLLSQAAGASRVFQQAMRAAGAPAISLLSDDCQADHERLVHQGAQFMHPPTVRDYGGTDAVLDDGCGNLLNLHQR